MNKYASVVIDAVIGDGSSCFDYIIPEGMHIEVGMRVFVPFGKTDTEGFVLGVADNTRVDEGKLKAITKCPDGFAVIAREFLAILDDICDKFKLRKIDVLRLFVPSVVRGKKTTRVRKREQPKSLDIKEKKVVLTEQQQFVVSSILKIDVDKNKKNADENGIQQNTFVLHGVTGSGKTEVYMHIIDKMMSQNKTAIMLVPEIGLTPQVLSIFRARFGETVAILHSGLTPGERYDEWLRLAKGEARIAIGARSAIFAPVQNLGVIIIDEEHDGSYFAESNPRYFTHEIAKLRARYNNCPLVLGSATPSVETYYKATQGQYKLLRLDRRVNNLQMPAVEIVDMIAELRSGNGGMFSRAFIKRLQETVDNKNQAIIFLNRRGFSSFVMCKSCGWAARCENCDVSLVYHKEDNLLKCHYCSFRATTVSKCQSCASGYLKMGATGTQKVVDELQKIFPDVPIFRMDADNTKSKDSLIEILENFGSATPGILVGTQMIAKGHHFPHVSLVGVIDADNSLHFSDYRTAERTFALITQVAGRAGRDASTGHVILQTYMPNHYVYRLAANYEYNKFFDKELNTRQVTKYPPFTTIVRVLITGVEDAPIKAYLQDVMKDLRERDTQFIYMGAMKSPLGRLQNKFRYQILMRFAREKESEILNFVDSVVKSKKTPRNCNVFLEINPQSLS